MEQFQCKKMNLQVYGHQVSGKNSKLTDKSEKFIYKPYSKTQGTFFEMLQNYYIGHSSYQLSKFIPPFYGIFTLSQILHNEDKKNATNEQSNLSEQKLKPVQEIAKEELQYVSSSPQRKEWIEHINSRTEYQNNQKFIKLKNLTFGFKYPNIMDLKLGIKKGKKESNQRKNKTTTTSSHGFRINGLSVRQFGSGLKQNAEQIFLSKYYCQKITQTQLKYHLGFFFFDGRKIHIQLLDKLIQSLKQLILGFMCYRGMIFESSSLYIAYDAYDPQKYTINFIDFDKYHEGEGVDESVERGLKSCLRHFIQISNSFRQIQEQLLKKPIMYYHQNHQVIPKFKQEEYQSRNKNSPKRQTVTTQLTNQ